MAMKNDALKKHHYWIVAVVAVVLSLVAFFLLFDVSSAVEAKTKEITDVTAKTRSAQAPGKTILNVFDNQKEVIEAKRKDLWQDNWNRQKSLYVWPKRAVEDKTFVQDPKDNTFTQYGYDELKFGTIPLPKYDDIDGIYKSFKRPEYYKAMYERMALSVKPTRFNGGWPIVFAERYIPTWDDSAAKPRQLWLALEDVWVQQALLAPIAQVNAEAVKFRPTPGAPSTTTDKTFESRTWRVHLMVDEARNTIKGTITNVTKQMQLLGKDSRLKLKVKLSPESQNYLEFEVQGDYLKGDEERPIPEMPIGSDPFKEIVELVQDPDERTVPVRQIERLSLGLTPGQFGPYTRTALVLPGFWKEEDAVAAAAGSTGAVTTGGEGGRGSTGTSTGTTVGATTAGTGGAIERVVDGNRKRYIEVTPELRRMPVAIEIVVDLRYMQDIMVAYANSPLRMQIVQYHWCRYRGVLNPATTDTPPGTTPGTTPGTAAAAQATGNASPNVPLPGRDSATIPGALGEGLGRGGRGGRGEGGAPPPQDSGAPPVLPGTFPGTPAPSAPVTEAQANSSLVKLSIFGIVTLYENPDPPKDAPAAGTAPEPAKPNAPAVPPATPPAATPPKKE